MRHYGAAFVERKRENESKGQRWLSNHKVRSLKANVESSFLLKMTIKHTLPEKKPLCQTWGCLKKVDCMKVSPEDSTSRVVLTPQLREEGRETQPLLYLS